MFFPDASVNRFLPSLILLSLHFLGNRLKFKFTILNFWKMLFLFFSQSRFDPLYKPLGWPFGCVQIYLSEWGFKTPKSLLPPNILTNYDFVFKKGNIIMAPLLTLHLLERETGVYQTLSAPLILRRKFSSMSSQLVDCSSKLERIFTIFHFALEWWN